jgi:hypothetical protein
LDRFFFEPPELRRMNMILRHRNIRGVHMPFESVAIAFGFSRTVGGETEVVF